MNEEDLEESKGSIKVKTQEMGSKTFVADEEKKSKYYIHSKKSGSEIVNPQDSRCRTFNVPKDFRSQFRKDNEEKKEEVTKLGTKDRNTFVVNTIIEENEASVTTSGKTAAIKKEETMKADAAANIINGTSVRLSR